MAGLPGKTVALGSPQSSIHQISQVQLADWMTEIEGLTGLSGFAFVRGSAAALSGLGTDGDYALVVTTAAERGIYQRASGTWSKVADLPLILSESLAADQAEADRILAQAAAVSADDDATAAAASATAAASSQSLADVARTQAQLAAVAAGATLYASVAAGEAGTVNGDVFLVATEPGVQVYENAAGTGSFLGWMGEVLLDDVAAVLAWNPPAYPQTGLRLRTREEGFGYSVLASGATDEDLTTAGSVNLRALLGMDGRVNVKALGAVGDGSTDDTAALQRAYSASSRLLFPAGTYLVNPPTRSSDPTGFGQPVKVLWEAVSNTDALFLSGAKIKLANNSSTDASPQHIALWFWQSDIENFRVQGGVFDYNRANNPISPDRGSGTYTQKKHIVCWGWRAGCDDFHFHDNRVENVNGANCIVLEQPLSGDSITNRGAFIRGNTFFDVGYDAADHTTINSYQDNTHITGNYFVNTTSAIPAVTNAVELHGSQSVFSDNTVRNMHRACYLGSNLNKDVVGQVCSGNDFRVYVQGVYVLQSAGHDNFSDITVADNNIFVQGALNTLSTAVKCTAIRIASEGSEATKEMRGVSIDNNNISFPAPASGPLAFYGVEFEHLGGTKPMAVCRVTDNTIRYATIGVICSLNVTDGLIRDLTVDGNLIYDCTNLRGTSATSYGIFCSFETTAPLEYLSICGNNLIAVDVSSSGYEYGIGIASAIETVIINGNGFHGIGQNFNRLSANQVRMFGTELRDTVYSSAPAFGTWERGAFVRNVAPSEDANSMVALGWVCTVAGSPGTWATVYASTVTPAT